ncbi:YeeE/YedE family integral membrane protein [Alternaria rosae]|uniref:YeeE/YedE family integral membrane protein n=1 Tax=Alternaria rosae TaxID=1187941 RepID=UPI001E8DFE9E|nr:YeeE/YedE family integral membrane protein [Alternaria rosae]KAH6870341.1 YeeE/YedE family integral membrane protein [Alternaria rosae]
MFTPIETSIGAFLLHQATSNQLYQNGDILGLSGYLRRLFSAPTKELLAFFTGMVASYVPLKALAPQLITEYPAVQISPQNALVTLAIGALIGCGTKMSNGCTSGHMLCGLPRLSGRSAIAVATFFPTAVITHHLANPSLSSPMCPGSAPCYTPVYPSTETTASLLVLAVFSIFAARTIPKLVAQVTAAPTTKDAKHQPADTHSAARLTTQSFSGLLFALGLHISQMAHPGKVAAFFSFPDLQHWDPSLALVILFGVLPNLIENQMKGFTSPPSFAHKFSLPTKTLQDVDRRFVVGAAAFGVGWGLTGICPGPAVLRAFFQPVWGALWIGGFWLGGKLNI